MLWREMAESDFEQDLGEALQRSMQDEDVKIDTFPREGGKGSVNGVTSTAYVTTGKARRRKRRHRNEPESIIGELRWDPLFDGLELVNFSARELCNMCACKCHCSSLFTSS